VYKGEFDRQMSTSTNVRFARSCELFERSKRYLSGGVSSGLRAASKPIPLFFQSGSGSHLIDVDNNRYIDYTLAWGPLILGHCDPGLNEVVTRQLGLLQQVGAQHELEGRVAEQICRLVPCAAQVVFSNTGSEAVQIAIRLARAHTGRQKIIRFEGHYHGWLDNALVGYRPAACSSPPSMPTEGMNSGVLDEMIVLPWNDLAAVEAVLEQEGAQVAAVITEPILCNSGCLMPLPGYLEGLRNLTTKYGAVLIFDEVITGFRVALGGAQALFRVTPDLATFGKAIAGGFSLSAVAGSREIMRLIEQHRVVHAGTFNGNPVSLAAAGEVLSRLESRSGLLIEQVKRTGEHLIAGIRSFSRERGIPILINGVGSVFHLSFTSREKMVSYRDTLDSDLPMRDKFIEAMLEAGIYLLPDGRWYLSAAHTEEDIEATLVELKRVFAAW
jgi:glutamate-1-semialdehyde 2,1-aminomutase